MQPGSKTILLGLILFILGGIAFPAAILLPLLLGDSIDKQFSVPGTLQVTIEEPGRYYLWNEYQTIFKGRTYNRPEDLPDGMEISITDTATGRPFAFITSSSMSMHGGNEEKRSIGYIKVSKPTEIRVEISGDNEGRIFSFARATFFETLKRIFGGIALAFFAGSSGIGLVIWGIVRSVRAKDREDQDIPPAPDRPDQDR
ncbi:MAG: hypothetical protein WGN25_00905 [Candidatus Electrothrix sp. GW3-4]|uniref:hypothetical protein n=1 Tax=Candidatus Electrothrix sp. GW3-4 TaxID=3126740 RepID=UPI0030CBB81B